MRLIDVDELLTKVNKIKYLRKLRAKTLCDECREVEAIPVEWLEKRLEHFRKLYDYALADKNKYMEKVYSTAINELSELLNDWREENDS